MIYELDGYMIDAEKGVVYGLKGLPITCIGGGGYIVVRRSNNCRYAHRMIWEAVHGPIDEGLFINHINGIKSDNRIANLELVTSKENMAHAIATGLFKIRGDHHHNAKLSEADVQFIRTALPEFTPIELAKKFGISKKTVHDVRAGRSWPHLPGAVRKK